ARLVYVGHSRVRGRVMRWCRVPRRPGPPPCYAIGVVARVPDWFFHPRVRRSRPSHRAWRLRCVPRPARPGARALRPRRAFRRRGGRRTPTLRVGQFPSVQPHSPPGFRLPSLGASHRLASLVLIEDDLSDPYGAGGDLHAFVLSSKLQRFLQRKLQGRGELFDRVRRWCAHVREFLLPGNVDVHVIATRVLTVDLPFLPLRGGVDEEGTAV